MKLVVFSHKECWQSKDSKIGWATDGGFAMQMDYLAKLFDSTEILVPQVERRNVGEVLFTNTSIRINPLKKTFGRGLNRKLLFPIWFLIQMPKILKAVISADAIHTPIPGDIGTVGFVLAHVFRKKLFIRYCGNWVIQKTSAEHLWKWYMEKFAGGKRVFLATGGDILPPSKLNNQIQWIFSSSMTLHEIQSTNSQSKSLENPIKLCIVARQDVSKGTGIVIDAVNHLVSEGYKIHFDIVGNGPSLQLFKNQVANYKLENYINFHGKLNHEQVLNVLKNSHIFTFPSQSEGFPKVVIEAMSQGLVIITTPVSVLTTLIPEAKCGYLMEERNSDVLVEILRKTIEDKNQFIKMSQNAIQFSKQYTLEKWTETIGDKLEKSWKIKLNPIEK